MTETKEQAREREANAPAVAEQQRVERIKVERARWAELRRRYTRCKLLVTQVWEAELDAAMLEQRSLAEAMRDRGIVDMDGPSPRVLSDGRVVLAPAEIPVPLFTPRDRVQFLKEASVALFIEACKQNLPATPDEAKDSTPQSGKVGQEKEPLDAMPAVLMVSDDA